MLPPAFGETDALILVDVQVDFCPGGALPVKDGDAVVAVLNEWISAAEAGHAIIAKSRDWHPEGHISFHERGGPWPAHCIQDTAGAAFHPRLALPPDALIVSKGTDPNRDAYSAFDGTGLAGKLRKLGVRRVWAGGLAQDICVRATVLDALKAGFEAHVITDATRAVDVDQGKAALRELQAAGAIIEGEERDAAAAS